MVILTSNIRSPLQAVLPEDSRNIAVTFYQLGIALGFNMKYEEAVVKLEEAISVLKKRIDNLKNKTESFDESKKDDVFYSREKEIAEIEALIPEIQEKIADTVEMKEEDNRKMAEVKEQMGFGSSKWSSFLIIHYTFFCLKVLSAHTQQPDHQEPLEQLNQSHPFLSRGKLRPRAQIQLRKCELRQTYLKLTDRVLRSHSGV